MLHDRIYLQSGRDSRWWTWCQDRICEDDVEYVRADLYVGLKSRLATAVDSITQALRVLGTASKKVSVHKVEPHVINAMVALDMYRDFTCPGCEEKDIELADQHDQLMGQMIELRAEKDKQIAERDARLAEVKAWLDDVTEYNFADMVDDLDRILSTAPPYQCPDCADLKHEIEARTVLNDTLEEHMDELVALWKRENNGETAPVELLGWAAKRLRELESRLAAFKKWADGEGPAGIDFDADFTCPGCEANKEDEDV